MFSGIYRRRQDKERRTVVVEFVTYYFVEWAVTKILLCFFENKKAENSATIAVPTTEANHQL